MSQQGKLTPAPKASQKAAWGVLSATNWQTLQGPQRRGMLAVLGGLVALLALLGDLPPAQGSWLAAFSVPMNLLFGWGAVLVCMGGLVVAGDLIVAAVRGRAVLPPGRVWGAAVALALLLLESHILFTGKVGGLLGYLGAAALQPLPLLSRQIVVFGALVIDGLLTFQISWHEVRWLIMASGRRSHAPLPPRSGSKAEALLFATPPPQAMVQPKAEPPPPRRASRPTAPVPDASMTHEGAVEALRVPAYLRRGTDEDAVANFALPPLAPRATMTINTTPRFVPTFSANAPQTPPAPLPRFAAVNDNVWRLPTLDVLTAQMQRFSLSAIVHVPGATFREVVASAEFQALAPSTRLALALGSDGAQRTRVADLGRFPHLLLAGATGAGTTMCLNAIIAAILLQATPDQVRFVLLDPAMASLTPYADLPHLLTAVVTQPRQAAASLEKLLEEMDRRLQLFARLGVRDIASYAAQPGNDTGGSAERLPHIVVVVAELADLMTAAADTTERLICQLARLARTTGIHLVVATQRPSEVVITGPIKATIPTRLAFKTASLQDSRVILDSGGAEQLRGGGDMLFLPSDSARPERIQCAAVSDEEIGRIVAFWVAQSSRRVQPRR